jgi:hypothetical protein
MPVKVLLKEAEASLILVKCIKTMEFINRINNFNSLKVLNRLPAIPSLEFLRMTNYLRNSINLRVLKPLLLWIGIITFKILKRLRNSKPLLNTQKKDTNRHLKVKKTNTKHLSQSILL